MQVADGNGAEEKARRVQEVFTNLIGLKLSKSSSIFATRLFHFSPVGCSDEGEGYYTLVLECPWRVEGLDKIIVGSEDYGERADDNMDPAWEPGSQFGDRQDQRLRELFGELKGGDIVNTRSTLVVERTISDGFGGFRLDLSGRYALSVFPATSTEMEWMLRRRGEGYLALMKGALSGSVEGSPDKG